MNVARSHTAQDQGTEQAMAEQPNQEMLRFITCGSVDDGKSTLIGRMLLEAGAVYEDQIESLRIDSRKHGTNGQEIDPALLMDGLEDERQQGITIDVAYRYFTTGKRKFIIADTPGHEQFTRNMVTGASLSDLAIILVDARKGMLTQTRRHAFVVSLLGVKHVILAVNKMDLVDYDQSVFERICREFQEFAGKLNIADLRSLPLSALKGDNVAKPSDMTPWYTDGPLLHLLETIFIGGDRNLRDLRFPVQWVNRPDSGFRGFSGTLASGVVRVGETVQVLPSGKMSQVRGIETMDGPLSSAQAGDSVTLTMEDEIDITRGDMIVRPGNLPVVSKQADAMLVWLSEQPMQPGRSYWYKQSAQTTSCEITHLRYGVDVNTLHRRNQSKLELNEIGRCQIETHDPIIFDSYRRNRHNGSFILVDRISHETVAAGMFVDAGLEKRSADRWNAAHKPTFSSSPVGSLVSIEERNSVYQQQPLTILISGLSGSGKTTVARSLEQKLFETNRKTVLLDGQTMRTGLSRDLGFSAEERSENLRRAAEVARLVNEAGLICIASFLAPHEDVRAKVKNLIGAERFFHVYLSTPVEVCRQRDHSGIYQAADRQELAGLPGAGGRYEPPSDADLTLSAEDMATELIVERVIEALKNHKLL